MSKRTQVEQALREIDQADFQRLGDAYLRRRGYTRINPIGLAFGRQKTTAGTPDTLVVRDDGKYVFVEYTTLERGIVGKFHNDLLKCFDESETGVPVSRIAEVVLCHNRKLEPKDELSLRVLCESKGVKLTTVGLGEIAADLVERYPAIAEDLLGIEVDSGQILRPEDFVRAYGRAALATPLDTEFLFRETEVQAALDQLEHSDVVLLAGRPGVGKTRLALEVARLHAEAHAGTQVSVIFNRGADLFRELKAHFAEAGQYILVVDDANRVSSFPYVLDLLRDTNEMRTVKIVATVRDYALDVVEDAARQFGAAEPIRIGPMTTEQIHALVGKAHGITNHLYLERIVRISEGNPRLALMAASLAAKQGALSSLNDATALYEEYFRSIKHDLDALGDSRVVLAAGVIAFFRNVDRTHAEQMGVIGDTFDLDPSAFWKAVRELHRLEVVDLYGNEVVRISDQVLGTYLFYVAAFRDKSVDLSLLLTSCFPRFRHRFIEALNPILSTFDALGIAAALKPHLVRALEVFEQRREHDSALELIDTFATLIPEQALVRVHASIESLVSEQVSISEVEFKSSNDTAPSGSILSILGHFHHADDAERRIAVELALAYIKKRPRDVPLLVRMLTEDYGITHRSWAEGFAIQRQVADLLISAADGGRNALETGLLLAVAGQQLRTRFHRLEPSGGSAYTSIDFHVPETPELRAFRNQLWDVVLATAREPLFKAAALQLIGGYLGSGLDPDSKAVVTEDLARIVPFLMTELDPTEPRDAILVHDLLENADRLGIEVDPRLEQRFAGGALELYEFLTGSRAERQELGGAEYEKIRQQQFDEYTSALGADGVTKFLDDVERLHSAIPDYHTWTARHTVSAVLSRIILRDPDIFATALLPRLQAGRGPQLEPYGVLNALINRLGPDGALDALTAADYPRRWFWLLLYCTWLPASSVGERQVRTLLDGYRDAPAVDIPTAGLDYLVTFQAARPTIGLEVARILEERLHNNEPVTLVASSFFGAVGKMAKQMTVVFKDDVALAKRLYISVASRSRGFDHDASSFDALATLDAGFAREWASWILTSTDWQTRSDDSRDYSRLWLREDADTVMRSIFTEVLERGSAGFSLEPYLLVFFRVRADHRERAAIWERQDAWLSAMIRAHCDDKEAVRLLFEVVGDLDDDRKRVHIATLLGCNTDCDLFRSLRLGPNIRSWRGSAVPTFEAELDFYRSILPLCNSVTLLKHRQYVTSHIEQLERTVDQEKKKDFMRD